MFVIRMSQTSSMDIFANQGSLHGFQATSNNEECFFSSVSAAQQRLTYYWRGVNIHVNVGIC